MKEYKREYASYDYFNSIGLQEHFEEMAKQGWLIIEVHSLWYIYKAIEPQELQFHITYLPYEGSYNGEPTPKELELEEFCLKNGWKLAAHHKQMQVYYTENKKATPIETDVITQVENLRKSVYVTTFMPAISYLFIGLYNLHHLKYELTENVIDFLSSTEFLFQIFLIGAFLAMAIRGMYRYYHWKHKAKAMAENEDEFLPFSTHKNYFTFTAIEMVTFLLLLFAIISNNDILVLIGLITLVIILIIAYFLPSITRKYKVLKSSNVGLTIGIVFFICFSLLAMYLGTDKYGLLKDKDQVIVGTYEQNNFLHNIYDAPLPVTLEDLVDTQGTIYSKTIEEKKSSFLLGNTAYLQAPIPTQESATEELWYRIVDVKKDFLYAYCKDSLVKRTHEFGKNEWHYEKIENEAWHAKEVYEEYLNGELTHFYFVCYDKRFIFIRFPFPPTDEQIEIVAAKLKN